MIFERTESGQENRAAFLEVDYVCYVEGGGGENDFSDDVIFWNALFRTLRPDLRIHFLARGGKPQLETRARHILDNDIQSTLVAMDSDFDELLEHKINDRRILYTHGYSWENDILPRSVLEMLYSHKIRATSTPPREAAELDERYDELTRKMLWPVRADYYALVAKSSVLPRDKPGRVIGRSPSNGYPEVRRSEVRKLCQQANAKSSTRVLPVLPKMHEPMRYCAGKIYAYLMFVLVCGVLKSFSRKVSGSFPHFIDVALLKFPEFMTSNERHEVTKFHIRQLSEV
ncbi:MAG: DUF4435 domain-containing protein [Pseudomonadota bacterium]